ncbi:coiled-coil domain-containing protein 50 isoform X4 [Alosa sapidissima]|uniref:coiled-coil domain-containing protein 50 isoform X4 n=1 Tax=Alosa sapidissima TaxID=34773 RepID=UPI001C07FC41|nr:coiled-coil domain-containing protein 50 isoform X4 [Alosa sapidissima]
MADFSIDQENLPGVKEVCRDFAVLEDHCLAHNLQEQEIESHLASNINRSRLVQQDLLVAKRLQEEEDLRAKEKKQQQHQELEQIDSEIAQVIQEQLVRQAEQQRQQEEKDAAIARKLQEKEEKRRQKQLETKLEDEYYEEKGGRGGRGDFGVVEAQQGLSRMALREQELREQELQELRDMEVARRMQEEELKASQISKRAAQAAQVAQDEEIARMLMEEDKKVFKKARDREREKPPMDRRKPEGDWRPAQEEVVRPRSREEYDQQRARNHKSSRPAPPRTQDYENVPAGGYGYPEPHYPARPATRPDAAYKGSYYKQ